MRERISTGIMLDPRDLDEFTLASIRKDTAQQALALGILPKDVSEEEARAYFSVVLDSLVDANYILIRFWDYVRKNFDVTEDVQLDTSSGELFYYKSKTLLEKFKNGS